MSKIPDEIKLKVVEAAKNYMHAMNTDDWEKKWVAQGAYTTGASFGYQLAREEVAEKDYQINELIRTTGNAQDTLIKEIERLKGLLEQLLKHCEQYLPNFPLPDSKESELYNEIKFLLPEPPKIDNQIK